MKEGSLEGAAPSQIPSLRRGAVNPALSSFHLGPSRASLHNHAVQRGCPGDLRPCEPAPPGVLRGNLASPRSLWEGSGRAAPSPIFPCASFFHLSRLCGCAAQRQNEHTCSWEGYALPNPPLREGVGQTRFPHVSTAVGSDWPPIGRVWGNPVSPYVHLSVDDVYAIAAQRKCRDRRL